MKKGKAAPAPVGAGQQPAAGGAVAQNPLTPVEPVEVAAVAPCFPVSVGLRNDGRIAFSERATNAFVGVGGRVTVAAHDQDQLDRLRQNIEAFVNTPGARLVVTGLTEFEVQP